MKCCYCSTLAVILLVLLLAYVKPNMSKNLSKIKQKHVVITGASSGIGQQFAVFFSKLHYEVTVVARREPELQQLKAELLQKGAKAVNVVAADLSTTDGVNLLTDQIKEQQVGCFVNCSGITHKVPNDLTDLDAREVEQMLQLHVVHATTLIQKVNQQFKK